MFKGLKNLKGVKFNRKRRICAIVLSFMVVLCTFLVGYNLNNSLNSNKESNALGFTVQLLVDGKLFQEVNMQQGGTKYSFKIPNNVPTKEGYEFLDWSGSYGTYRAGQTGSITASQAEDTITYRLYARWKETGYTIAFDTKGASETVNSVSGISTSSNYTLTTVNLTKTGYTFAGWDTNSAGTTVVYANGATVNGLAASGATVTLYAVWNPISYQIAFNNNSDSAQGSMSNLSMTYGTSKNLTANAFTRENYNFAGWNTEANGSGTNYSDGQSVTNLTSTNGGTVTLYAKWTPITYSIEFDKNDTDAQGSMPSLSMTYDVASNLTSCTYTKEGYTFDGWATSPSGEVTYTNNQQVINLASTQGAIVKLYAKYVENSYSVAFDANASNAQGTMSNETFTYTESKQLTANAFSREAYTFDSWNTSQEGTGIRYTDGETVSKLVGSANGVITLYAIWTPINYTVSCSLNGGDSTQVYPINYNIESETFSLSIPNKTGYTFTGWTGENLETNTINVTIPKGTYGNKTYEAHWSPTPYSISYDLGGGSVEEPNPDSYTIESSDITLNNPTKRGYTFIGWTGTGEEVNNVNVTIPSGEVGDRSYVAHWELTDYEINCELNGGDSTQVYPINYNILSGAITLAQPTKEGYKFTGWTGANGESPEKVVTISPGSIGDKNYEAHWEAISYTIVYELGTNGTATNPLEYTIETETITLTDAERPGYDFEGWTEGETSTPVKNLQITTGSTGNKTFVANWKLANYTISYDLKGGSLSGSNPNSYTIESEPITLINPEKTGYTFKGWKDNNNVEKHDVTIPTGSYGNRSYEAEWISDSNITYQVNHYKMNIDGATYTLDDNTLEFGTTDETITISELKKTYEGFTFEGGKAFTTSTSEGNSFDLETTVLGDNSRVINMYYSRNKYKVELDKDEGIASLVGRGEYFFEAAVTLGATLNPTYQFVSWTDKIAGTVTSLIKDYVFNMPSSNVSLISKSKLNDEVDYTVSHYKQKEDKSGYELIETENKKEVGEKTILINGLSKTYEGYNFDGGKVDIPSSDKPASFDNSATINLDGTTNINLYYSVKPSGGGGGGGSSKPSKKDLEEEEKKRLEEEEKKRLEEEAKKRAEERDAVIHFISGYPDKTFKPNANVTRAEFAEIISSLIKNDISGKINYKKESDSKKLKQFKDVNSNNWYASSLSLVTENDLMIGYGKDIFKPDSNITRAEVCKVLSLMFEFSSTSRNSKFDKEIKNRWYEPYVKELVDAGLIDGYKDGKFKANNKITRGEVVSLLTRIIEAEYGKVELSDNITNPYTDIKKTDWYYENVLKCTKNYNSKEWMK